MPWFLELNEESNSIARPMNKKIELEVEGGIEARDAALNAAKVAFSEHKAFKKRNPELTWRESLPAE